jgi:hypothetical protein
MTTSERSTVVGVFADRERADKAIDDLRRIGFSYNQIRLAERGTGSFLDSFKSLFTGQQTVSSNTPDDLRNLGVPEPDAHSYQRQLDAGRAIVIVNATGHIEQALAVLHQSGAYDISARLRTAEANVPTGAGTPQPAAAGRPGPNDPNAPQGTYTPNAPQGTYIPNVPQGPYNPNAPQQGTYPPNVTPEPPRASPRPPRQE